MAHFVGNFELKLGRNFWLVAAEIARYVIWTDESRNKVPSRNACVKLTRVKADRMMTSLAEKTNLDLGAILLFLPWQVVK